MAMVDAALSRFIDYLFYSSHWADCLKLDAIYLKGTENALAVQFIDKLLVE